MKNEIIYGVFAMDIDLPKVTDSKKELNDLAEVMKSMSKDVQERGRFVMAYKRLQDAVTYCCEANGYHIAKTLEVPDGVMNGKKQTFYYPKVIEVNQE